MMVGTRQLWWFFLRLRGFLENVWPFIPRLCFSSFFLVEISSRTLIPLFRPGSVHSSSASWDDWESNCGIQINPSIFEPKSRWHVQGKWSFSLGTWALDSKRMWWVCKQSSEWAVVIPTHVYYSSSVFMRFSCFHCFSPVRGQMVAGETSPPPLLTEADLISLMEKHGIGLCLHTFMS